VSNGGRRLRNLRAAQVIAAFERLGYSVVRTRGSHFILRHPDLGIIVLPVHRDTVKAGIIMDALKKGRISLEEFEAAL
jgi:predicted RNA binding protein YcfA (HicA-like mRNA interferase family)